MAGRPYSLPAVCFYLLLFACGQDLRGEGESDCMWPTMNKCSLLLLQSIIISDNSMALAYIDTEHFLNLLQMP